jgi:twitching motility protein PilT
MDQHLAELVKTGRISYETGLEKCHHMEDFNRLTGRAGGSTGAGLGNSSMGGQSYSNGAL